MSIGIEYYFKNTQSLYKRKLCSWQKALKRSLALWDRININLLRKLFLQVVGLFHKILSLGADVVALAS